jgi:bifunctional non-homologous end joining protein LigD
MTIKEYRKKRHFDLTPEPSGSETKAAGSSIEAPVTSPARSPATSPVKAPAARKPQSSLRYVIQKHRASHLHYDFRLEWNGVLLSWAVPKGPSLDPSVKRLAMQVEDHPLDYADFEGVIPEDEYGGGTVMVWDKGTWTPDEPDVDAALRKGELKFTLNGVKLKGSWVLVRTQGYGSRSKTSWLLIKHRDQYASPEDIAATQPQSVVSKRLLSDIAREGGGDVEKAATGDPATKPKSTSRSRRAASSAPRRAKQPLKHRK